MDPTLWMFIALSFVAAQALGAFFAINAIEDFIDRRRARKQEPHAQP